MFNPTNVSISSRKGFRNAFGNFMTNFIVSVKEDGNKTYILKTWNSVEEDFYNMEKEANKIISNASDAAFVRKTYEREDFLACVEEAEFSGFYLSIPDHLVAIV